MRFSDIPRDPPLPMLRQFGFLCLLFVGGGAAYRIFTQGPDTFTAAALAGAATVAVIGILRPGLLRGLFVAWMIAAFPIGWMVSHIALGLLYYGVFAPTRLLFRLIGRDRLRLRRSTQSAGSHWVARDSREDPADYFKQF